MSASSAIPSRVGGRRPGRPRSAQAEQAILDAALEILEEVGIEALSIEGVAARAKVGKTTIYRRWPTKEALIIAVVRQIQGGAPLVDTGNLRADLLTVAHLAEEGRPKAALVRLLPRFLGEAMSNPVLFEAYLDATFMPRFQQAMALIARAQGRGEIRADLDPHVVLDLVGGALIFGWLLTGRIAPLPPDFSDQVIDTLWRGIGADATGD